LGALILALVAIAVGPNWATAAARFWLSASASGEVGGIPPANAEMIPSITQGGIGSTGQLFIWATPELGKTLANWSLRVVATHPEVVAFPASPAQPSSVDEPYGRGLTPTTFRRWESWNEPAGIPAQVNNEPVTVLEDLAGFSFNIGGNQVGVGIGAAGGGGAYPDSFHFGDTTTGAWLLARVNYTILGPGHSEVYLQIGSLGINHLEDANQPLPNSEYTNVVFGALTDPALNAGARPTAGRLKNSATPEALITIISPDFNRDADVDGDDFLTWQRGFGLQGSATHAQGDADGDLAVNATDLAHWRGKFGSVGPNLTTAVPEPCTWATAILLAALTVGKGRRPRHAPRRGGSAHRRSSPGPYEISVLSTWGHSYSGDAPLLHRCLLLLIAFLGGSATASGQEGIFAIVVNDDFDSYADTADFSAVWTPIGTDVGVPSALISTTQSSTAPNAVFTPGTLINGQYRNRLSFTETSTYSTSGNLGIGDKLVWSYDFYDSLATPARNYSNLQDGVSGLGTNSLVAMGLNNNRGAAADGGDFYFARILGYTPTFAGALSGDFFKLNDAGAPLRASGWNNLKVEITTSDALSTDYRFYVNNVLAKTILDIGNAAQIRSYDNIVLGSGLGNANTDAYFDNMKLEYFPKQAPAVATWTNPAGGAFETAANWQNSDPPGANTQVVFNLPNTYTVTLGQDTTNSYLLSQAGDVTISLQGQTYTLTDHLRVGSPQAATLKLSNGHIEATYGVASSATETARLILDNATLTTIGTGLFDVGIQGGRGELLVTGNSLLDTEYMRVGENAGSDGLVKLTGSEAHAEVKGMQIGATGTGRVEIRQGATMHSTNAITLGNFGDTSHGEVLVTGIGSALTLDETINVGDGGTGIVAIEDGATFLSAGGTIGLNSTAVGTVTLDSLGIWQNSSGVTVGQLGEGHLTVQGGAYLATSEVSTIGNLSTGDATITGVGTRWDSNRQIQVGRFDGGDGHLTISAGAIVESFKASSATGSSGIVGSNAGSEGSVTIIGLESRWSQDGGMVVGSAGAGTLDVFEGGLRESEDGFIARFGGSAGDAEISGSGSTWNVSRAFFVGGSDTAAGGSGSLAVYDQGSVQVGQRLHVWPTGTVTVSNGGKIIVGSGDPPALGTVYVGGGGTLSGTGTIVGATLVDGGRVAPGNSPGILHIDGDYTQTATGTLEIEIGGLVPGTGHDQVVVAPPGVATLDGALVVPLINGFQPQAGQEVTFLTASTITGGFKSITAPGLANANQNLAIRVQQGVEGSLEALRVKFVDAVADIQFNSTGSAPEWSELSTWVNAIPEEPARVPETTDVIALSNLSGSPQTVVVQQANAGVHRLTMTSGTNDTIKLGVTNGKQFNAVTDTLIGDKAIIELDNGSLVSATVVVEGGGVLAGNGTVKAPQVTVGGAVGANAAQFSPGLNAGQEVGSFVIDGNYQQAAGGDLEIDITGDVQFDQIALSGSAHLGGTLTIDVNGATLTPGTTFEVLTAGNLAPDERFDDVNVVGTQDFYFAVRYLESGLPAGVPSGAAAFTARSGLNLDVYEIGDMNPEILGLDASDVDAFAMALTNKEAYRSRYQVEADDAGNCDGLFGLDFDDIDEFVALFDGAVTTSQVMLAIRNAQHVPEASTWALAAAAGAISVVKRRRLVRHWK